MRIKIAVASICLILPFGTAMADGPLRSLLTSGATLGSSYLSSSDHKRVIAIQDDASSFVASDGEIRGAYFEATVENVRKDNPGLHASDMELAQALLAQGALPDK